MKTIDIVKYLEKDLASARQWRNPPSKLRELAKMLEQAIIDVTNGDTELARVYIEGQIRSAESILAELRLLLANLK